MHLLIWAEDSEAQLRAELMETLPGALSELRHSLPLETDFDIAAGQRLPDLVFSRQFMPNASTVHAESIRAWASEIFAKLPGVVPETEPWALPARPMLSGITQRDQWIGCS
jgi:hypothetical protein